jgi:hypothetical protein
MWEESLTTTQPTDLAGDPCPIQTDAADAGTPTSRTLPDTGEAKTADTWPVTWTIRRLPGQHHEPPRR